MPQENRRPAVQHTQGTARRNAAHTAPQRTQSTPLRRNAGTAPQRTQGAARRNTTAGVHAAPRPRQGRMPKDLWKIVLCGAALIGAALLMQMRWPTGMPMETAKTKIGDTDENAIAEIRSGGPVRLNELMSSNSGSVMDENGNTPDWVEVMNVSSHVVDLDGYSLAKSEKSANVFTFPSVKLAPNECIVVFADATELQEGGKEMHAPFRISSKGGSLMLFSPSGTAIDAVNFPALAENCTYARVNRRNWMVSDVATPGRPNETAEGTPTVDEDIEITEIVASNTLFAPDENGVTWDYIELHNRTGEKKDLSGWYLSDDPARPTRWSIPDGFVLAPDEYRIIYAAGTSRENTQTPYASFGLSTEGETVTLYTAHGTQVDSVTFDLLHENKAWSKAADGTWSETTPTPAGPNG